MLQLRASIPALFTDTERERSSKNRATLRLASSPKAEVTGSNPVGCTNPQILSCPHRHAALALWKLCASYSPARLLSSAMQHG